MAEFQKNRHFSAASFFQGQTRFWLELKIMKQETDATYTHEVKNSLHLALYTKDSAGTF